MTLTTSQPQRPHVKRWTKREYNRAVDLGAFAGQRIFLFRGELIEMPPMGQPHAVAIMKLTRVLTDVFRDGFGVRIQLPMEVPGDSMPEPDGLVCGAQEALRSPHPNTGLLVIEIGDSSLDLDQEKADYYAAAKIPEYWILSLPHERLATYRDPVPHPTGPTGWRYAQHGEAGAAEAVAPIARPDALIKVSDLLP